MYTQYIYIKGFSFLRNGLIAFRHYFCKIFKDLSSIPDSRSVFSIFDAKPLNQIAFEIKLEVNSVDFLLKSHPLRDEQKMLKKRNQIQ